jgi:hypothetical protein
LNTHHPLRALAGSAVLLLACAAAQAQTPAAASESADDRGFSYFLGLGRQTVTYQEHVSMWPIRSKAEVSSPMLVTGALYSVSPNVLMTFDGESTFAPGKSTERWTTSAAVIGNTPITDPLLQTNQFSLQETHTKLLLHYRLHSQLFALAGPSFRTNTFTRSGFVAGTDGATDVSHGTVVETASEAMLHVGFALDSERVRGARSHYGLRLAAATPVWRRLENTSQPGVTFTGTRGYDLSLAGRYSWSVYPNVQVGGWAQYTFSERARQSKGLVELPRNELSSLAYGLELLWKL